jgi:exodeoxyribonuclease VII small subunit
LTGSALAVNAPFMSEDKENGVTGQKSDLSFEEALGALEDIVSRLESGSVPLDESISLYERGEELRKQCQARLDAAQQRIEKIVTDREGNATGTAPLDGDG